MLRSIVCLFLACYVAACAAEREFIPGCDQTNEGNEFFVGFFRNRFGLTSEQERIPPVLWITTKESTPVNFTVATIFGPIASGVATAGEITYVDIPLGFVTFDSTENSDVDTLFKGIRIKAEDDRRIVVFGQHEEEASNDAYLGLPVISLPVGRSYEYIAASIFGDGGTVSQAKDSVALIIGTENDTEIILEPSVPIRHAFAQAATGGQFIPGVPVGFRTVIIQRFQTFYLQVRGGDISGTRIIANKPISVFSGHECANIPLRSEPCDILIEQLQPIDTWGTEAVTVPLRTRSGDVLKVFASQDSTTVNVTYTDINSGTVTSDSFTLDRNGFRELGGDSLVETGAISDFALIQSNNPIAVFQFSRSYTTDNNITSDPFMLTVPSCEQYRNMYAVATAPFDPSIEGTVAGRVAYVNYTNIAVPAEFFNASLITVNNNPINPSEFRPIRRADNSTWGYGAQLLLDEGAQVISHSDPNAALSVIMYGFSNQMSWGYIAGTGLAPVALSVVSFEATNGGSGVTIAISESAGPLVIVLVLSEAVDEEVSVFVIATPITARAGEDFGPSQNYTVTFPVGSTRQSVDIPIINDTVLEPDETFSLEISVPEATVRAGVIDGCDPFTPRQAVTITDNDPITVMFSETTYDVNENAGPARPVLVLSNPSSMDIEVTVTNTDGSATGEGVDYGSGPYTVTFPAGMTRVPFNVSINNDDIYEGNENFMLTINPSALPTGVSVGSPDQATVTIVDDDPFTVMFEQPAYNVSESAGPARPVLVLSNPSSTAFTVQVTNTDGSATGGGVDYGSGPYTVMFPAGVIRVPFNVSINNDMISEANENFMLTIDPASLPTGGSVGTPGSAVVTIIDDDPITVMFSDTTYSVNENAGPARPVLVLSNPASMTFEVQVTNTDGSATGGSTIGEGVDYVSGPYTVTFQAGMTSVPFDIAINDDNVFEGDENFMLTIDPDSLPNAVSVTVGTPDQATVTIVDNDNFTVMFEQSTYSVNENAGPARPVLVLSNPSSMAFTVQVTNTDGSATGGGVDYGSGPYTIMFPAGVTSVPFNVSINNDMISEANEDFTLTIDPASLPTGGSVGTPGSAVVTIIDDDPITVMFNETTYSVNENAGPARPVLVLSNPASMTFAVQVTNTDGSATGGSTIGEGVDYVSGPYTVTFQAGMTSVPFDIAINNDDILEGNEDFMLTIDPTSLPNAVSVTVGTPDQATVTIVDNDPITVMFEQSTYSVNENAGPARPVLVLSNPSSTDFNVTVTNTDGSATGGVDYGSGPYIVTIPAGMTRVPFDVPIIDDGIQEGSEDFMLTINPSPLPTGVTVGSPDQATVTIADDEDTLVMFEQSTYSVNENAGPAQPVLILSNPSSTPFNVTVTNTDGSATGGVDYESGPYIVTFPAGETRIPFNISITNDGTYEGNEDFMLTIDPTLPDGIMVGTPDQATVTIVDNDPFTVMFEQPAYNVSESAGPAQPVLVLSNPSSTDFNVTVTSTDGSATGGVDYGSGPYIVTFTAGMTRVPFDVPITDDMTLEGNEDFTLTIDPASVPTGGSVGSPGEATVTIVDDDPITVMFSDTTYSVNENAGPARPVIVLSNPSSTDFNVTVTNTDGSATGGVDYESGPYTVTIPAGMTNVPFDIPITDDGILEGNEDFMLTINPSPLPTGVSVGTPDQATVTIVDVGSLTVMFEQSTYSVNENAGPAQPVLVLSGPSSTDVVVEVTNTDGSATGGGVDYGSGPYTVTFPAGETRVPFNVSINNDDILEDNEDFMLTINPSSVPTGVTVGSPDQATVTIVDDDPITVMFDRRMYSVDENAGPAQPTVVLSNPSSMNMTVEVRNVNNTAVSGDDYSPGIYSVMIPAGQTMVPFDIGIVDDDILEGNEDFDIVIVGATLPNRVSRGNPSRSTVTIVDDDPITVMFSDTTYSVNENTGPARPVLVLSGPSSSDIEVTVNSNDGSATGGGVDYGSGPYVVTIPAGMTMFPFDIPIINDDTYEGVEDFMITIDPTTLPDNVTVGTPGEATVTIADDDTVTVRFANATGTVTEGDGTVTIIIEKVGDADIPVTVTVTTSDGTATAGSDYGTRNDTNPPVITPITIPAGESSANTTVRILDDNCREEDETFNGELSVVSGQPRVILGTPDRTVITIVDDDVSTVEFLNAPYTVVESSGAYNVCLSITPVCDLGAMVTIGTSPKDALPNSDYMPVTRTVTFAPNQMVACIDMNNIIDDSAPEPTECFQLVIMVPPGSRLVPGGNANVTIIDDDPTGPTVFFNDTVIGDPLYEVPMNMISNQTFTDVTSLCYEIHGEAGQIFNLISDGCVQVNANYSAMNIPENGNIISQIGVLAYDNANGCAFITVDVNDCIPIVNGVPYNDTVYNMNGVTARRRNGRARITVPNCDGDADDLVFWVVCQEISGQRMIKFQVMRGSSLQPDSHGLIGQFWNIPVTATGPISPPPIENITDAFRVTVEPQLSQPRSFVAELFQRTWDRTLKPCLYAGNSQGGPISEVANDASVIEGEYFEYEVDDGIFGTSFTYNRLQDRACPR